MFTRYTFGYAGSLRGHTYFVIGFVSESLTYWIGESKEEDLNITISLTDEDIPEHRLGKDNKALFYNEINLFLKY